MSVAYLNRCIFRATAGGTSAFEPASAITGYLQPGDCTNPTVVTGATYRYYAQSDDLSQWEVGYGTWDGTSLSRDVILESSSSGSIVTFSAAPRVAMGGPIGQDIWGGPAPLEFTAVGAPPFVLLQIPPIRFQLGGTDYFIDGPCLGQLNDNTALNAATSITSNVAGIQNGINLSGACTELNFPNLVFVSHANGDGFLLFNSSLTTLDISSLRLCGAAITVDSSLTEFDAPSLEFVGNGVTLYGSSLTSINLPSLVNVIESIGVDSAPSFTTLVIDSLVTCGGFAINNNESFSSFSMPSSLKAISGDVYFFANALDETSVDGILVFLAGLDGTSGTTSYDNHTIDLSGGTNAPPSGTGLAAITTLEGRGNTVNVNS